MHSIAVILGSAFGSETVADLGLDPEVLSTPWGDVTLYRFPRRDRAVWLLFRHGVPHRFLPNQIPYRAQAAALAAVGCRALLVTSSVGVLDARLPLNTPMLVEDVLTLDNRLPDGGACTMFVDPTPEQGHLVLSEGLLSPTLTDQVRRLAAQEGIRLGPDVIFGYVGGPRSKTRAENRMWSALGAGVNSMTVGPEVILATELGIPCAGLVIGHKYSIPDLDAPDRRSVEESLVGSRAAHHDLVLAFLHRGQPVRPGNHLYRYGETPA